LKILILGFEGAGAGAAAKETAGRFPDNPDEGLPL